MRVRNGATKAALTIATCAAAFLTGTVIEVASGSGWGVAAGVLIMVAGVAWLTRSFRGGDESDAPREWWRMTASPAAGYVLSAWFLLQAIGTALTPASGAVTAAVFSAAASGGIAVAYLNSSVRLTAQLKCEHLIR